MTRRSVIGIVLVAALLHPACRGQSRARVAAERATLERRLQGLEAMLGTVEKNGRLFEPDDLLIVIRERLVEESLASILPFQRVIKNTYRVRIDSVQVQFEDGFAVLALNGEAHLEGNLQAKAAITVHAGLDVVEIDPAGVLRARVHIYAVETRRARLFGVPTPIEDLVERIGKEKVDTFAPLLSSIDIPVRLDREILLPRIGPRGGVTIEGYSVPFRARVKDVKSLFNRLWITVRIERTNSRRENES